VRAMAKAGVDAVIVQDVGRGLHSSNSELNLRTFRTHRSR